MLSIEYIRKNKKEVKAKLILKGDKSSVADILNIDKEYRENLLQANNLRAVRNKASEEIANAKRLGNDAQDLVNAMRDVSQKIKSIEEISNDIKDSLSILLENLPNLPHDTCPKGEDASSNIIVKQSEDLKYKSFKLKNHVELGEKLNLFDFEREAKISGSGFPLYIGKGAKLERSLINYMLDIQTEVNGYIEVFPPFMVRSKSPFTTGNLPKFSEDMYHSSLDNLWMIPTAEVPLTNIHQDEILNEHDMPIKYAAYSACFRREAGSYGKDTRGFLRLHQFNKVELVQFVKPENSYKVLELLTTHAERILQSLGLKYRVVELCSADLSFSAAKCYDLEVWAPGENKWLEVSSCSNFEDFQASRGNIRYRKSSDNSVDFVHTLNGSGLATPRLLVALLETYQNKDGSITVPESLRPYYGSEVIN